MDPVDDLDSEWTTLKNIPGSKPLAEDINLRDEYMSMGEHPEFVYTLLEAQYGMRHASLWRMKCFGQKRRGAPVYPRRVDCWVVQYDKILWEGDRRHTLVNPIPRDINRRFLMPKKQCCVTLDEMRAAFAAARDKAIESARYEVERQRTEIAQRTASVIETEAHIAQLTGFMPEFE